MKFVVYSFVLLVVVIGNTANAQKKENRAVVHEVNVAERAVVKLVTTNRRLIVKTWDRPVVKIATQVAADADKNLSGEEWLKEIGISLKSSGNRLNILAIRSSEYYRNIPVRIVQGKRKGADATKVAVPPTPNKAVQLTQGQRVLDERPHSDSARERVAMGYSRYPTKRRATTIAGEGKAIDNKLKGANTQEEKVVTGYAQPEGQSKNKTVVLVPAKTTQGAGTPREKVVMGYARPEGQSKDKTVVDSVVLVPAKTTQGARIPEEKVVMGYARPEGQSKDKTVTDSVLLMPAKVTQSVGMLEEKVVVGYSIVSDRVPPLEITVPAGSVVDIESQYGTVSIEGNVEEAKLDISYGSLEMGNVRKLAFIGKYCDAYIGNVEQATVEFENGTLRAETITELDIDSKSSKVRYEWGNYLFIRSQADHYTIEEIGKVEGQKMYGSVHIDRLLGNFDLQGKSVDIKIRSIDPQVEKVRITNRYGAVRLPVKGLANYFVDFTGYYASVFTPFNKKVIEETEEQRQNAMAELTEAGKYYRTSKNLAGEVAPGRFTGSAGDLNGKHTRFELVCHNCTVDFK